MWGKIHRYIPALIGAALTAILILVLVDNGPHSLWQVLRLPDFVDGTGGSAGMRRRRRAKQPLATAPRSAASTGRP